MGDLAVDMVLASFDWQLHGERLRRVLALGLTPVPNPVFLHYLGEVTVEALGRRRSESLWPFRSMVDAGIPLVFGTDAPAYWPIDPLRDVGTAVTRRSRSGAVIQPNEAVTPFEALRASTVNAAHLGGMEDRLGIIRSGMLADLVVLQEDPLSVPKDRLAEIAVDLTVMNGRVTYERT
jgi:predicted amidohydrolase YtcJ